MEPVDDDKRFAHRKAQYKKTVDEEGARRKREENLVRLGKAKKEEQQAKRRQAFVNADLASCSSTAAPAPQNYARVPVTSDIPHLMGCIRSSDEAIQLEAVSSFRKMLSREDPPIDRVVELGLVHIFVRFLHSHNPRMQLESAWALTNVASGSSANTNAVVEAGALPLFVSLLQSADADVREQALWALGNIAGDGPAYRDLVLRAGALEVALRHLGPGAKLTVVRNTAWLISNCIRGKPAPPMQEIAAAIPMLAFLVYSEDDLTLADALWALSYFTERDGDPDMVQLAVQSGVCSRIAQLLCNSNVAVQTPALRTIGNIVTGDDLQTQAMINARALESLQHVLGHSQRNALKKEVCWAISNVMAGNKEQLQAACDANLVQQLVLIMEDGTAEVRREACWALSNATSGATPQQLVHLVRCGVVGALARVISGASGAEMALVALEGLDNMLRASTARAGASLAAHGVSDYEMMNFFEHAAVPDMLSELETDDPALQRKASNMLKVWFADYAGSDYECEDAKRHSPVDYSGPEGAAYNGFDSAGAAAGAGGGAFLTAAALPVPAAAVAAAVSAATGQFQFAEGGTGGGSFGSAMAAAESGWGGGSGSGGSVPSVTGPVVDHSHAFNFSGMQFGGGQ